MAMTVNTEQQSEVDFETTYERIVFQLDDRSVNSLFWTPLPSSCRFKCWVTLVRRTELAECLGMIGLLWTRF